MCQLLLGEQQRTNPKSLARKPRCITHAARANHVDGYPSGFRSWLVFQVLWWVYRDATSIMDNQMEKKMESEMDTGVM